MLNGHVTQDMASTFTMRAGSEFQISVNVRQWHFRESQELNSCISSPLVNTWMVMPYVNILYVEVIRVI